jgi:hypothetical protein
MKQCPECNRDYEDESLLYCLDDGHALVEGRTTAETIVVNQTHPSPSARVNKILAWALTAGTTLFFEIGGFLFLSSFRPSGRPCRDWRSPTVSTTNCANLDAFNSARSTYVFGSVFLLIIIALGSWLYLRSAGQGANQTTDWSKMRNMVIGSSAVGFVLTLLILVSSIFIYLKG